MVRFVLVLLALSLFAAADAKGAGTPSGAKALPGRWTTSVDKTSKPVVQAKKAKKKDENKKPSFFSKMANELQSNLPSRWNLGAA